MHTASLARWDEAQIAALRDTSKLDRLGGGSIGQNDLGVARRKPKIYRLTSAITAS